MSITNYTELQAAVGTNWLNRSDLTSRVTEFIALAEADIRRKLRDTKLTATITASAGSDIFTPAAGVKEIESLRLNTSTLTHPLRQKSPAGLAEIMRTGSGIPTAYAVVGGIVYFDIACSDSFQMRMTYIGQLTPLSGGSPTNSTLTNSPDIYLYGALSAAAPFLEHDTRLPMWQSLYESAIEAENIYRERQEFGGSPEIQLPVVFGADDGT